MAGTQCSECDEEFEIAGRPRLGQKVTCNHCGAQLEVVATDPFEVEVAQEDDSALWEEDDLNDAELALEDDDVSDDESDELDDELLIEDDFEDDEFDDDLDAFDDNDDDYEEDDDEDDDEWR